MQTVSEIKQAILELPIAEYAEMIEWLYEMGEREWEEWDRQFEEDVKAGRLDILADEALAAKARGELRDLKDI
ncbi:MAG: hypothetical protein F4X27_10345 [Chloroflexi bacterium]|nr:hypothetical protein [Chloroflexota bacterium]